MDKAIAEGHFYIPVAICQLDAADLASHRMERQSFEWAEHPTMPGGTFFFSSLDGLTMLLMILMLCR